MQVSDQLTFLSCIFAPQVDIIHVCVVVLDRPCRVKGILVPVTIRDCAAGDVGLELHRSLLANKGRNKITSDFHVGSVHDCKEKCPPHKFFIVNLPALLVLFLNMNIMVRCQTIHFTAYFSSR